MNNFFESRTYKNMRAQIVFEVGMYLNQFEIKEREQKLSELAEYLSPDLEKEIKDSNYYKGNDWL